MRLLLLMLVTSATAIVVTPSRAQDRHALLIANSDYRPAVGRLPNTERDIERLEAALTKAGFKVRPEKNLDAAGLRKAVAEHAQLVKSAGKNAISFFYYAGHGLASPEPRAGRQNFLLPIDLDSMRQPDVWQRAVALEEIAKLLEEASEAKHFVVFDACRSQLNMPDGDARPSFVPIALSEHVSMLFAFATAPGRPAWDGLQGDENSPYAIALADELVKPNIDHLHLFAGVRTAVANRTGRKQIPWIRDGFLDLVYLRPLQPGLAPDATAQCTPSRPQAEEIAWQSIQANGVTFKRDGGTYVEPRADAGILEQADKGERHFAREGTVAIGTINGKAAWYSYVRNTLPARKRFVPIEDAELR